MTLKNSALSGAKAERIQSGQLADRFWTDSGHLPAVATQSALLAGVSMRAGGQQGGGIDTGGVQHDGREDVIPVKTGVQKKQPGSWLTGRDGKNGGFGMTNLQGDALRGIKA